MEELGIWDVFVVLLSVAGPPKVLLGFATLSDEHDPRNLRRLAVRAGLAAMVSGIVVALTADPLLRLFHLGRASVEVAGGAIFFVYALRLVLDGHPAVGGAPADRGFGALLVPYVASPLAMTSIIVLSVFRTSWTWPVIVVLAYLAVAAINLTSMIALTYVLHRVPRTWVDIVGRLLGLLLAAVGVELVAQALSTMGILRR